MSETNTNPEARVVEAVARAACDFQTPCPGNACAVCVSKATAAISAHTKALAAEGMVIVKASDLEALPAAGYDAANGGPLSIRAAERAYLHLKSKVGDMIPTPTLPPAGDET